MPTISIKGGTVVTPDGSSVRDLLWSDGKLLSPSIAADTADEIIDADGMLIMPGLIDCHVHFRDPGYPEKGTMKTESEAAMAGGITTVCDMPNTIPPVTTIDALRDKVSRAAQVEGMDLHFFFGVTEAEHLDELEKLWTSSDEDILRLKKRCCGVKLYLEHSTGNQKIDPELVPKVFSRCAHLQIPIVCHAEDAEMIATQTARVEREDVSAHSAMRPPEAEAESIKYVIDLAREHEASVHIAHLSTKEGADLIRSAKKEGLPVTCEVTTHHLFLSSDDYETLGTLIKVNPPIRTKDHCDALWEAIADGTIDCVATDHAPHTLEEKGNANQLDAPSGMPGVETSIPLLLSIANGHWPRPDDSSSSAKLSMEDIVRLCFINPNTIFNLHREELRDGNHSPLIIIDPNHTTTISSADLHYKCGWTPYEGWEVQGKIVRVLC